MGNFPKGFEKKHHDEVTMLIKEMIKTDPQERPSASEIMNGEILKVLKKKVSKTKQPFIPIWYCNTCVMKKIEATTYSVYMCVRSQTQVAWVYYIL